MSSERFRRALVIWDIDGTLLEPRGVGRQALNQACRSLCHVDSAFDGLDFAGATDHHLWEQAAERHPRLAAAVDAQQFFIEYSRQLRQSLKESPLKPLPGVPDIIPFLSASGWPMVLGTGNIRAGAYLKLGAAGLANYFPGGGFSQSGAARAHLLDCARRSAGREWQNSPAVVIGDTPRDIDAAHATGASIIAVATGRFSADELKSQGADVVLETLEDRDAVLQSITLLSQR